MNSSIILNEADKQRLKLLLDQNSTPPRPDPHQQKALRELLSASLLSDDPEELAIHAGFYDKVIIASPHDARDHYGFSVVMPRDADVDAACISILAPISLAVMGRSQGDAVSWDTPAGKREMKIISIMKADRGDDEIATSLLELTMSAQ